jgi:hypothetical protein
LYNNKLVLLQHDKTTVATMCNQGSFKNKKKTVATMNSSQSLRFL